MLLGPLKPLVVNGLEAACTVHKAAEAKDRDAFFAAHSGVRAIACSATTETIPGSFMARFPKLQIVASFGVGYDHMDAKWAAAHGVILTNTPAVLTEEVADTALGLLLCTVREFPQAERSPARRKVAAQGLSAEQGDAAQPHRRHGRHGRDRPGDRAAARRFRRAGRLSHAQAAALNSPIGTIRSSLDMARDVDTLMVIVPGGAATANMIDAEVLDALGPNGILINMARGSVVDEPALIEALKNKRIMAAGLDVYVKEPEVPAELIEMDNVVLFPHLGSASVHTRDKMDQLVVDNIVAWAEGKPPLTPVPETTFKSWSKGSRLPVA